MTHLTQAPPPKILIRGTPAFDFKASHISMHLPPVTHRGNM